MARKPMIEKLESRTPFRESLVKSLVPILIFSIFAGVGGAWTLDRYLGKRDAEVMDAFSGSCGQKIVKMHDYGDYEGQPYSIARQEFERLRNEFPKRFEKISNDTGTLELMKNYSPESKRLGVPRYDCN